MREFLHIISRKENQITLFLNYAFDFTKQGNPSSKETRQNQNLASPIGGTSAISPSNLEIHQTTKDEEKGIHPKPKILLIYSKRRKGTLHKRFSPRKNLQHNNYIPM